MAGSAARLEVVSGNAAGMSLLIDDELVIGRLAEGAGRLADDEEISRSHARISMDSRGLCAIEDLGSTNGTFVNGMRIAGPQTLSEGDTIELGGTTLVVREIPQVQEEPVAEPADAPAAQPAGAPPQKTVVPGAPVPGAADEQAGVEVAASPAPAPEAAEAPAFDAAAEAPAAGAPAFDAPAVQAPPAGAPAFEAPAADEPPAEAPLAEAPAAEAPLAEAPAAEAPLAETSAAQTPPSLSLQVDVDFAAREVRIRADDEAEPVRLVYQDGTWRPASSPSIEKGDPA